VNLNVTNKGVRSGSIGRGGWLTTNVSRKGVRNTLHVPGSGMSYQTDPLSVNLPDAAHSDAHLMLPADQPRKLNGWMIFGILCGVLGLVIFGITYLNRH
jgi:hypothetical protein